MIGNVTACHGSHSLLGRVLDEINSLLDVALEILVGDLEKLLLLVVGLGHDIDDLLSPGWLLRVSSIRVKDHGITYAKFNGCGEEIGARCLCNGITTSYTGEIDEAWLDNALLAVDGLQDLLGESVTR